EAARVETACAGNVNDCAIEDAAGAVAGIEAVVDEVAQRAARLRAAQRIDFFRTLAVLEQWIAVAAVVGLPVPQEADGVANDRVAEPEDQRVAAFVDDFINPSGLESGFDVKMRVGGNDRSFL